MGRGKIIKYLFYFVHFVKQQVVLCRSVLFCVVLGTFFVEGMCCTEGLSCEMECTGLS